MDAVGKELVFFGGVRRLLSSGFHLLVFIEETNYATNSFGTGFLGSASAASTLQGTNP